MRPESFCVWSIEGTDDVIIPLCACRLMTLKDEVGTAEAVRALCEELVEGFHRFKDRFSRMEREKLCGTVCRVVMGSVSCLVLFQAELVDISADEVLDIMEEVLKEKGEWLYSESLLGKIRERLEREYPTFSLASSFSRGDSRLIPFVSRYIQEMVKGDEDPTRVILHTMKKSNIFKKRLPGTSKVFNVEIFPGTGITAADFLSKMFEDAERARGHNPEKCRVTEHGNWELER